MVPVDSVPLPPAMNWPMPSMKPRNWSVVALGTATVRLVESPCVRCSLEIDQARARQTLDLGRHIVGDQQARHWN